MRLYSWNVNGIRAIIKKNALAPFLAAEALGTREAIVWLHKGDHATRVAVVHPAPRAADGTRVAELLASLGVEPVLVPVPDGEAAKTAGVASSCWSLAGPKPGNSFRPAGQSARPLRTSDATPPPRCIHPSCNPGAGDC